jgi:imidazolonepropionase
MSKILIKNIGHLLLCGEHLPNFKRGREMQTDDALQDAYLAIEDDVIVAYGKMDEWAGITDWRGVTIIDAENRFVFPAFCDSHTHTVFAATREEEFEYRIKGLTYEEIAAKGGGILNSAKKLSNTSEDVLYEAAKKRLDEMMRSGTGAVEIKSGYGLSVDAEIKMLRVIQRLKKEHPMTIKSTFLGAHAFPTEYKSNQQGYVDLIIKEMLPIIAEEKLADYIDCFCERNYFTVAQMAEILEAGKSFGLIPKVHVNQFSILGGVQKAVELGALSVDHLEEIDAADITALQQSDCIATLLPGCSFFLSIPYGNAKKLMENNVAVALASDFNPGSAPSGNLLNTFSLACIKMKMTPVEALNALTINGSYAMGLAASHGRISLGAKANVIISKPMNSLARIPYSFGENNLEKVIINGAIVKDET